MYFNTFYFLVFGVFVKQDGDGKQLSFCVSVRGTTCYILLRVRSHQ